MNNLAKVLLACLSFLPVSCVTSPPETNQIDFNTIEIQSLFFSEDEMQQKAQNYLNARFPHGYPINATMAALIKAGAKCTYQTDPQDPTFYFCDYSRPGHGLAYFYEQIDWAIEIEFSIDKKTVKHITVIRYGSSL